ncbi:hypothetical protein [Achromobacter sp.]|uniref:hypothetical protein n=1 Tax=Achromobacter sp. TaxID=134375 RepID=UPI00258F8EDB|nr:hypothetical protein [Achromobacter sp.]
MKGFDDLFDSIVSERESIALTHTSNIGWFRKRFDKLQRLIDLYKGCEKLRLEFSDTAYGNIRKLAQADGVMSRSGKPLSDIQIADYLKKVRAERGIKKELGSRKQDDAFTRLKSRSVLHSVPGDSSPPKSSPNAVSTRYSAPAPEKEFFPDSIQRIIKEDANGSFAPWNGKDEFFLSLLLKEYREKKHQALGVDFWNTSKSPIKWSEERIPHSIRVLKNKLLSQGIFEHYKDVS